MYGDILDEAILDLLDFDEVEDFDNDAPGEWLGVRLETTDIDELNGHQLVEFVAAVQRQRAHLDALALRATQELVHCPPGDVGSASVRSELPAGRAAGELELHCGWTPYKAGQYVSLGWISAPTWQRLWRRWTPVTSRWTPPGWSVNVPRR